MEGAADSELTTSTSREVPSVALMDTEHARDAVAMVNHADQQVDEMESSPRQLPNGPVVPDHTTDNGPTPPHPNGPPSGAVVNEEPTVDVTSQQDGGQSVQNMLSSVIYSLGLSEEEELQHLSHWHNRTIIPSLDTSTLA